MKLLIVESPSKAKTINKYLGNSYKVLASYGHIRDLPSKNGSVDPDNNFAMIWDMDSKSKKQVQLIKEAAKSSDEILLATDPDREGEAIAWHVMQVLEKGKLLKNKTTHRIVFNEINKNKILEALQNPRKIDDNLIQAYLTRRALDYLVGFNLSPVLWRKLPGCKSAGRVQSVALRLINDKEAEIESFVTQEYWSIIGIFSTPTENKNFSAKLSNIDGKKLDKFAIKTKDEANELLADIPKYNYKIDSVTNKQIQRKPVAPFITSTLQQEASRKLYFGVKKTMQVAQKLYEGLDINGTTTGLITYMRTDSTSVSKEAIEQTRTYIKNKYSEKYLPKAPQFYKSKVKNAQEAHEAIRPTDIKNTPTSIKQYLDKDQIKLYEIIWKRMLTSQMANAILNQTAVDIISENKKFCFHASGTVIKFDGFMKVYSEGNDDEQKNADNILPTVLPDEKTSLHSHESNQHFTKPPARYTEASIVKKLEELGIGRPSTYASIISTLIDREYVKTEKRQLIPEALGRILTAFLMEHFTKYLEYDFTAKLEEQLDEIASGKINWEKTLEAFWLTFKDDIGATSSLKIADVIDSLNEILENFLFKDNENKEVLRKCPDCNDGTLSLKLGKFGAFIGCSNYPNCKHTKQLSGVSEKNATPLNDFEPQLLGKDKSDNQDITLRKGPYGFYLQWGENIAKKKPKRVSIPKNLSAENITLETALTLGELPKTIGQHPKTTEDIIIGQGRFGPYITFKGQFVSIPKNYNFLEITVEEAVDIIIKSKKIKI